MKDLTQRKQGDVNGTFETVLKAQMNRGLYYKLHKAKGEIGKVSKNAKNPFFKSNYADLNSLIEAVEPVLLKYDLILLQPIIDNVVHSQIIDIESGDMVSSHLRLPVIADPQKLIASITYYRRGTLQSLLSLQAVDDDGNSSSKSVKETKKTITDIDFNRGVEKMEVTAFKKLMQGYELTDTQTTTLKTL